MAEQEVIEQIIIELESGNSNVQYCYPDEKLSKVSLTETCWKKDTCAICKHRGSESVIECYRCKLQVHASCYLMRKEDSQKDVWCCQACFWNIDRFLPCLLCTRYGGVMRRLQVIYTDRKTNRTQGYEGWAHALCCQFDHGAVDTNGCVVVTLKKEWPNPMESPNAECELCDRKMGCCIRCSHVACDRMMHTSCALSKGYLDVDKEGEFVGYQAYCDRHVKSRVGVKQDVVGCLIHGGLNAVLNGELKKRGKSILAQIRGSAFRSMDELVEVVVDFLSAALTSLKGKPSAVRDSSVIRQELKKLIAKFPKFRKVFPNCSLDEHDMIRKKKLTLLGKRNPPSLSAMKCLVCSKWFTNPFEIIYCSAGHGQHRDCTVPKKSVESLDAPSPARGRKSKKLLDTKPSLTKSNSTNTTKATPVVFNPLCAVCGVGMDLRNDIEICHEKGKRQVARRSEGKTIPRVDSYAATFKPIRRPSMILPDAQQFVLRLDLVIANVPTQLDETTSMQILRQMDMLMHLTTQFDDKYAKAKIKKAIQYINTAKGPLLALLVFLRRDYQQLITQINEAISRRAKLKEQQALEASTRQQAQKELEAKAKRTETLLKKEQVDTKNKLKRKRNHLPHVGLSHQVTPLY